ncbi:MAG TPA: hypothetical protein VEQ59_09615 [Polyangiaceae bacterium]|nr:hypothetical protein [Polyangiaceae bacterium]
MTSGARAHESAPGGPTLRRIQDADGLLLASFGPVLVAWWTGKPTPETFERQRSELAARVDANPGRQLFMCVVSSSAPPPEQAEREGSAKMISVHGERLAGCACVIEGQGFRAAITRTVLTGIVVLTRTPAPVAFFENVKSAQAWLQSRAGGTNLSDLPAQLDRLR